MNIPIELLVLMAIIVFIMFWYFLMFILKRIKLWRYKPENDKGRRAEEARRTGLASIQRPLLPERRSILPTAIVDPPRENSNSIREPSNSDGRTFKNPFRRR
ncbi:MAG: hypothetical protein WC679_12445 [Bacteroidales bacterium]|jgi:hypothetical protein